MAPWWTAPVAVTPGVVPRPATEAPSGAEPFREQYANPAQAMIADTGPRTEPVIEPLPAPGVVDPPAERQTPAEVVDTIPAETISVEVPALDPLLGLLPVDVSAIGHEARALLDHVAALQVVGVEEWLGTDKFGWLVGAAAAAGGTVQAVRMYRTRGRASHEAPTTHFVLGRWEGDVGTDR
ncbi:hypothetical protein J0H58_10130 [bacterium]|nr:hypothetical protein [bacterium]